MSTFPDPVNIKLNGADPILFESALNLALEYSGVGITTAKQPDCQRTLWFVPDSSTLLPAFSVGAASKSSGRFE